MNENSGYGARLLNAILTVYQRAARNISLERLTEQQSTLAEELLVLPRLVHGLEEQYPAQSVPQRVLHQVAEEWRW